MLIESSVAEHCVGNTIFFTYNCNKFVISKIGKTPHESHCISFTILLMEEAEILEKYMIG